MAKAYLSHGGTSWKSSVQSVESGFKECTQVCLTVVGAHSYSRILNLFVHSEPGTRETRDIIYN